VKVGPLPSLLVCLAKFVWRKVAETNAVRMKIMKEDTEFQSSVQRIGELVREIENSADPAVRASTKDLVQLLLDLHAAGLERVLEIVAEAREGGQSTIDELGRDPLVSSLLVLYGLHPLDVEDRVARAVEKILPKVRKHGGEVRLLGAEAGMVRIRISVAGHSCASTGNTLRAMVEDAVYEAAPDLAGLVIEGLDEQNGAGGFVPLAKLGVASSVSVLSE
jgi:Fe-S cluster biogenesis protein NfuA